MQTNEREIIIEHALENEKNLEIMLDIIAADPKLQQVINTSLEKSGKFDFKEINMRSWYSLDPGLRESITETVVKNSSDIMSKDNNSGNERIITEHALKNEENLEMTLDIISMSQEIHERIIKTFLEKLKDFICKGFICKKLDMSQWVFNKELYNNQGKRYRKFGVSRKALEINVILEDRSTYYSDLIIGVHSEYVESQEHLRKQLNRKLNKTLEKGNGSNSWWIWYQSLKKPSDDWDYIDWNNKDTLVKMHSNPDCVVKHIGNRLLEIIKVAKPVIEEWVEKNSSAQ